MNKKLKLDLGASFEKMKQANPFPGNPMLLHIIQDAIRALPEDNLMRIPVREMEAKNDLKGAMQSVLSFLADNMKLTIEAFGTELVANIVKYSAQKAEEEAAVDSPDDIPTTLFIQPGLFGYCAD